MLLCAPHGTAAQTPPAKLTDYSIETWSSDDGLPQDTTNAILQTRDGHLWVGTYGGLARFDGVRFSTFTNASTRGGLPNNGIRVLAEDTRGTLWIGTTSGLTRWVQGRLTPHPAIPAGEAVRALWADRDGSVWVGTASGKLLRIRDDEAQVEASWPSTPIYRILRDHGGDLWVATHDGLRRRTASGVWTNRDTRDGLPNATVSSVVEDHTGRIWVATAGGAIARLEGDRFVTCGTRDGVPLTQVSRLYVDRAGVLWAATGSGLLRLQEGAFERFGTRVGLPESLIYDILEDREGILWLGTYGDGLVALHKSIFTNFRRQDGLLSDFAYPVFEDRKGVVWAGTMAGLSRLENRRFSSYTAADGLCGRQVRSLAEDTRGALWVATYDGGVCRLQDGRWTTFPGLEGASARAITFDHDGALWAGTARGLARLDGSQWTRFGPDQGMPERSITCLRQDRSGALWIGTDGGGLVRRDGGRFQAFSLQHGLASDVILALIEDAEGVLWIGTNGGLSRHLGDERFASYTVRTGLPVDSVNQLVDDTKGHLWIGSGKGIARVRKQSLALHEADRNRPLELRTWSRLDGMPSSQCTAPAQPAGWRGRDGRLWFTTNHGITVLDPSAADSRILPPTIAIESITADDRAFEPANLTDLAAGTDRIEFRYTALSFLAAARSRFRYRLVGFDSDWVDAGETRQVSYTKVPPGRYQFHVVGSDGHGVWNQTGATLELRVLPFFYQTWWFSLFSVVGVLAAGYGVHTARLHRLRRQQTVLQAAVATRTDQLEAAMADLEGAKRRAEAASDAKSRFLSSMSHEIRTPLNAIVGASGLLLDSGLGHEAQDLARIVRAGGDALLTTIDDILDFSKIEAGRLEMEQVEFDPLDCVEDALDLLAQRASEKGLSIGCVCGAGVPARLTGDPGRLRQVLLNLLSNAVKFTSAGEVRVDVEGDPAGDLRFAVTDSGIGISAAASERLFQPFAQADPSITRQYGGTGLGLAICRSLVERMGGRISVQSTLGVGSTFSFTIRLPRASQPPHAVVPLELVGKRLLVASRAAVVRGGLAAQARALGLEVVVVDAVADAIGRLRAGERYEFALLHDDSAVGSEGAELAAEIRGSLPVPRPRLILVASAHLRGSTPPAGFAGLLINPVGRASLQDALQAAFHGRRSVPTPTAGMLLSTRPLRVLVADDQAVNRKVAVIMLGRLGHSADEAADGQEVLDAVRRRPYDVILMDVQMPRMDGLEAARRIGVEQFAWGRPRIIAVTASATSEDRARCLAAGMDDYVSKPVKLETLEAVVGMVIGRTAPSPASAGVASLDSQRITELRALDKAVPTGVLRDMIEAFLNAAPGRLEAVEKAGTARDLAALKTAAHGLGGSSGTIGAARLAALCFEIESSASSETWHRTGEWFARLRAELVAARVALIAERDHPAPA